MNKNAIGISQKLLAMVIFASLASTLLASAVQFLLVYQREQRVFDGVINGFEKSSMTGISLLAWNLDEKALTQVLDSSLTIPGIATISVREINAEVDLAKVSKEGMEGIALFIKDFPLTSPDGKVFARLRLQYARNLIRDQVQLEATSIVLTNFITSILVSAFLLIVIQHMLVVPIKDLSRHFPNANKRQDEAMDPLTLRRKSRLPDELDGIVAGINAYQVRLRQSSTEKSLLIRDQDELVHTRTAKLLLKTKELAIAQENLKGFSLNLM